MKPLAIQSYQAALAQRQTSSPAQGSARSGLSSHQITALSAILALGQLPVTKTGQAALAR